MPCIRRRYHYAAIYIDDQEPEQQSTALVGNQLDALDAGGNIRRVPFGGFITTQPDKRSQPIILANIEAYAHEGRWSGQWIEFGPHALVLGRYIDGKAWIEVDYDCPVVWCRLG